ncbi:beta-ketoacyl-ACP synthase [Mesorhizobium sp. A623]
MSKYEDHLGRPLVAITGLGVVSSLGVGKEQNWSALVSGTSGIHAISRFPVDNLRTQIAGTVDFLKESTRGPTALSRKLAILAAAEAISHAKVPTGDFGGQLFLAAPPVELEWRDRFTLDATARSEGAPGYATLLAACRRAPQIHMFQTVEFGYIAAEIADTFGTRGLPVTLSTACASGATAIQLGAEAIRRRECDRVLSIGTDGSVTAEALIRFSLLSALSTQNDPAHKAAKPFSKDRDGFVMAEGAGALVMESLEAAIARGAPVLGFLRGAGEKADDFHRTRLKPDGSSAVEAVRTALKDADLREVDVDYVNAHGTSTPENDKMEYLALSSVFGDRLSLLPVSSNKSMIGHALTAAGAIEAVFSLMTIQNGIIPPTINYDVPDPAIGLDVVSNVARPSKVTSVLSNSFGFGGQNSCLVIAGEPA